MSTLRRGSQCTSLSTRDLTIGFICRVRTFRLHSGGVLRIISFYWLLIGELALDKGSVSHEWSLGVSVRRREGESSGVDYPAAVEIGFRVYRVEFVNGVHFCQLGVEPPREICSGCRDPMKESDITKCQIQEWYPLFRRVTFRTTVHVLPKAFVDYLLEDGVFLSRSSEAMPTRTVVTCPELQSEGYEHWEEEDDDLGEPEVPTFPELEGDVKASIEKLGGAVVPKLNWSAPKDTTWISTTGNLQCKNFGEILLLLKASDSVVHDLCHAFDGCEDKTREGPDEVVLALRKWYDLRPEREFRAFVYRKVLVGICQREVTGFYPALVGCVDDFEVAIADFFHESIRTQFDAENYTFDCYVTKDWTVKLVDFNPWACSTLPLLFSWEELEENYDMVSAEIAKVAARRREREAAMNVQEVTEGLGKMTGGSSIGPKLILAGRPLDDPRGSYTNAKSEPESAAVDVEYSVEMRIVISEGLVQPGLRMGTGIPIDFVDRGNWEEVIKKEAAQGAQEENAMAGG